MAEISQKDQLALHEFSVRYREAYAEKYPLSDVNLKSIHDAVRTEFDREQTNRSPGLESPSADKTPEPNEPDR